MSFTVTTKYDSYSCNESILPAGLVSDNTSRNPILVKIDDELRDLDRAIDQDCTLEFIYENSPDALEVLRHDAAHVLAQAVKELYPSAGLAIGPVIRDGFYYDIDSERAFSTEDFAAIEEKMHEIVNMDLTIERQVWSSDKAIEFFSEIGENLKVELIRDLISERSDVEITVYQQGDFIDLCRGPHFPSTKYVKNFKLTHVSASYWRGDSSGKRLQRIYGTAWQSEKDLKKHLKQREEAKKRDHRNLAKQMELFHIQDDAPGQIFWHPNGWTLMQNLESYIRSVLADDYQEVKTPILVGRQLWEDSGHWEKFQDNMFSFLHKESEDGRKERHVAIKPMNCPCHVQIFNKKPVSYKDLPIRLSEFGSCHRYEPSGSLQGLMRVRGFTQDDAHIFCTEEHIVSETKKFCELLRSVYRKFGFENIKVKLSDRPKVRAGSDETWDLAEKSLKNAMDEAGLEYDLNPGEGAFYGPKIEFVLTDCMGRDWQCGTLQLDYVLPARLKAEYVDKNGEKKVPVMIHRAILGSLERFAGILLEHYNGVLPLWIAPIQIAVLTVTSEVNSYADEVRCALQSKGMKVISNLDNERIQQKLKRSMLLKIPYSIVIGEKERDDNTLSVRKMGNNESCVQAFDDFIECMMDEISNV